jgi:hypothetical protein
VFNRHKNKKQVKKRNDPLLGYVAGSHGRSELQLLCSLEAPFLRCRHQDQRLPSLSRVRLLPVCGVSSVFTALKGEGRGVLLAPPLLSQLVRVGSGSRTCNHTYLLQQWITSQQAANLQMPSLLISGDSTVTQLWKPINVKNPNDGNDVLRNVGST